MQKDRILVARIGNSKIYYVPGTKAGEKDGIVSRDGEEDREVNIFSYLSKTSGIIKLSHTPFHSFFWDGDSDPKRKNLWKEIFILKIEQIPKEMLSGVIPASIGNTNIAKHRLDKKASNFFERDFYVKTRRGSASTRIINKEIETNRKSW